MLLVAGLSLWRGRWEERTVSLGIIAGSVATAVFQNRANWNAPQWGDLMVDVAYLALLCWVSLRSDRLWPLFAAAFQLISVIVFAARMADKRVGALAPYTYEVMWSYLILVSVLVGIGMRWKAVHDASRGAPFSPSTGS